MLLGPGCTSARVGDLRVPSTSCRHPHCLCCASSRQNGAFDLARGPARKPGPPRGRPINASQASSTATHPRAAVRASGRGRQGGGLFSGAVAECGLVHRRGQERPYHRRTQLQSSNQTIRSRLLFVYLQIFHFIQ
ncbi:hypothetical protein NDU88_007973 [Pleurodeles waltl]|uniref:Uncharacterized protein n=1 Tax=Pleurodeles waltl TaxID=8319 RepID=A0AAV7RWM4_PLEWA|nr:hypothetical protein NDU88_007973 [Pleurodeles waltl]